MSGPHGSDPAAIRPPRRVDWFTAACLLMSNIIGGGIFTTTGFLARDVGDPRLILSLWLIGALLALAGAMSYSELGAALPRAGGDYIYLSRAYGPLWGFLSGWTSFTVGFGAGIAASSVSFSSYLLRAVPQIEETGLAAKVLSLLLLWSLTAVHTAGVGAGGLLQRTLTTSKVTAIVVLILGGLTWGAGTWTNLAPTQNADPHPGSVIVALIFILYTYFGWNVAGYIAGEIADPHRVIPRIMIGGTACVAVIYLLLNLVYLYAFPVGVLAQPPVLPVAEKAAAALWGATSARLVAVMLCVSIAGAVSAMVWAGPRVYWAMAQDGVFAPYFGTINRTTGVPVRAIALQSVWASLLILTGTFEQLVIYSGFVLAAFSALTVGTVLVLRRHEPNLARPFSVPFYPLTPGLFIVSMLIIIGYSVIQRPVQSLLGVLTVLAGLPFYWLWRTRNRPLGGELSRR
ncbi:MAG: amino acid permease [Nitrospiraceae bacterium]|nr:amino acid permease [Nitrospiraceae bacterium]